LGSKKFRCTDGTAIADCFLVDVVAASLVAGQMSISVKDDTGTVHRAVKISARKITTSAGDSIKWNFSDSVIDNALEIEEAGNPLNTLLASAMIEGLEYEILSLGTVLADLTTSGADADPAIGEIFIANATPTGDASVILTADSDGDLFGL